MFGCSYYPTCSQNLAYILGGIPWYLHIIHQLTTLTFWGPLFALKSGARKYLTLNFFRINHEPVFMSFSWAHLPLVKYLLMSYIYTISAFKFWFLEEIFKKFTIIFLLFCYSLFCKISSFFLWILSSVISLNVCLFKF